MRFPGARTAGFAADIVKCVTIGDFQRVQGQIVNFPPYRPEQERDACGTGFVSDIAGRPSHRILEMALTAVTNLTHRGALDADAKTGTGPLITGSEETCPLPRS